MLRNPVMVAVHCFFGTDQGFDIKYPAVAIWQFNLNLCFKTSSKVADAQTSPRQSTTPKSVFKYKFLSPAHCSAVNSNGNVRSGTMYRMQICERLLDAHQILFTNRSRYQHHA